MPVPLMDLAPQRAHLRDRLLQAAAAVIDSGRFILGPEVKAFEQEAAQYVASSSAIGVANGTDALVLALRALGVGPGDEVICPAYTFYATPEAVAAAGAKPVFVDIEPGGFQIDPAAVEAAITPRTRAVVAVHLFGHPAPMARLRAICDSRGLPIVEDAAQAIGARLDGRACGSLGAAATFSFFPTKNLGGFGDGGLITTDDAQFADTVRMLRFHGSKDKKTFELIGMNSRLDELQAAFLRVLLRELDGWNDARRVAAERYRELGLGDHVELPATADGAEQIYHLYVVRTPERDALEAALKERGVGAAVYYGTPHHLQPVFADLGYREGSLPETERAAREGLALPMFPTISAQQQEEVVAAVQAAVALV
jgi:dTDP-4-amino-4,6-dideoxygalactose transaminase